MNNHLGKKLKLLRLWLGLGQQEFARAAGISPFTLSNYERGKTLRPEKLREIEATFDVDLNSVKLIYNTKAASGD